MAAGPTVKVCPCSVLFCIYSLIPRPEKDLGVRLSFHTGVVSLFAIQYIQSEKTAVNELVSC